MPLQQILRPILFEASPLLGQFRRLLIRPLLAGPIESHQPLVRGLLRQLQLRLSGTQRRAVQLQLTELLVEGLFPDVEFRPQATQASVSPVQFGLDGLKGCFPHSQVRERGCD